MITAGKDSGTAATARLIAVTAMSSSGSTADESDDRDGDTQDRNDDRQYAAQAAQSALQGSELRARYRAVQPSDRSCYLAPVAVTVATPRPRTTTVPAAK